IFVSGCAVALAFQTSQLLQQDIDHFIYGFIFFATLCSYNFYWILSKASFAMKGPLIPLLKKEASGISLFLIAAAGMIICFFRSGLPIEHIAFAMALTIIYSIPLLPFKALHFTRKAGVLKTILLAATWAYVTAFIPMQRSVEDLTHADLFVISRRFLFMLMLCIIFDNRDKAVDKMRGLRSLATDLEPPVLKGLIYFIFTLLFISNFFYRSYGISFQQSIALQVSTLALLTVYFLSDKNRSYLFYYFIVDGLMLFSALATYIAGI
ncbi:MAG TPA: hypothetical protein VHL77_00445, partial [Ferruginibacter sp.]|nr:hypothetical protein [Ferruginibacter sp.]